MEKVLLCSFDPMLKKGLQGPLSDAGFCMDSVDYPAEAIRLIMNKTYKAVILDTGGIGMDPYDAAIIIKNLASEVKVIILGANGGGQEVYSISKPVDTFRLKDILRGHKETKTISNRRRSNDAKRDNSQGL